MTVHQHGAFVRATQMRFDVDRTRHRAQICKERKTREMEWIAVGNKTGMVEWKRHGLHAYVEGVCRCLRVWCVRRRLCRTPACDCSLVN